MDKRLGRIAWWLGCSLALANGAGCSDDSEEDTRPGDGAQEVGAGANLSTDAAGLKAWLQGGEYKAWAAEGSTHPSTGPHFGAVRTYLNPALFDSLTREDASHPVGSAAVKELYGNGTEVLGWSVMHKAREASGGDAWYWLEDYQDSTIAAGFGASLCVGCHSSGSDHVRTPFPLRP